MNTAASVRMLMTIKDVTEADAVLIRSVWRAVGWKALRMVLPVIFDCPVDTPLRQLKRDCIDTILHTSGVEFLGIHKSSGEEIYYCNAGDTYATTVMFAGQNMRVGCIGDLTDKNLIKQPEQL